eukprot:1087138-Prorocentrum_lima.AAC.1
MAPASPMYWRSIVVHATGGLGSSFQTARNPGLHCSSGLEFSGEGNGIWPGQVCECTVCALSHSPPQCCALI